MEDNSGLIRKETRKEKEDKMVRMRLRMKQSLVETARSKGGLNVLRFLLHESGFLTRNTHITATGVNKDVLLTNEAKRCMYLDLRQYMDFDTMKRVEWDEEKDQKRR